MPKKCSNAVLDGPERRPRTARNGVRPRPVVASDHDPRWRPATTRGGVPATTREASGHGSSCLSATTREVSGHGSPCLVYIPRAYFRHSGLLPVAEYQILFKHQTCQNTEYHPNNKKQPKIPNIKYHSNTKQAEISNIIQGIKKQVKFVKCRSNDPKDKNNMKIIRHHNPVSVKLVEALAPLTRLLQ